MWDASDLQILFWEFLFQFPYRSQFACAVEWKKIVQAQTDSFSPAEVLFTIKKGMATECSIFPIAYLWVLFFLQSASLEASLLELLKLSAVIGE